MSNRVPSINELCLRDLKFYQFYIFFYKFFKISFYGVIFSVRHFYKSNLGHNSYNEFRHTNVKILSPEKNWMCFHVCFLFVVVLESIPFCYETLLWFFFSFVIVSKVTITFVFDFNDHRKVHNFVYERSTNIFFFEKTKENLI